MTQIAFSMKTWILCIVALKKENSNTKHREKDWEMSGKIMNITTLSSLIHNSNGIFPTVNKKSWAPEGTKEPH